VLIRRTDLTTKAIPEDDLEHLKTQQQLRKAWLSLLPSYPSGHVLVLPSVEHAIKAVEELGAEGHPVQVIVSGSLHLVGGVIEVAQIGDVAL
jgi:folylpolyglutamate synthase